MRHAIAIDLGGTHASVGIVRETVLLASRDIDVEATHGLASLLPRLKDCSLNLLQELKLDVADCMGISLSLPSLVDFRAGRVVSANNKYPDATDIDLRQWAKVTFGLPLVIENDARAALIGEANAGAARGYKDVVMLTLGTGVGSAVLTGGVPFRTTQPQGGNLGGHIPVRLDGRQCSCGAFGCMESEASGWALPLIAHEMAGFSASSLAKVSKLDFLTAFLHRDKGDAVAAKLIQHCLHVWSIGTVGLIHAFGPEVVVIGGGIAARSEVTDNIAEYVLRYAWVPAGPVRVVTAQLGNLAPLYAALPLLDEFAALADLK
jgi:glucokinase